MKRKIDLVLTIFSLTFLMTGCGMSEEAKAVQAAIDALPASYSASEDDRLAETEDQFDHLSAEDQAKVKAEKLLDLKQAKEDYIKNQTETVNSAIAALDLKSESVSDLEKSADDLNAIASLIENAPAEVQFMINYSELIDKVVQCHETARREYGFTTSKFLMASNAYQAFIDWEHVKQNLDDPSAKSKMLDVADFLGNISDIDTQKGVDAAKALADAHEQIYEIQQQLDAGNVTGDTAAAADSIIGNVESNSNELKTTLEELQGQAEKIIPYEDALAKWYESMENLLSRTDFDALGEALTETLEDMLSSKGSNTLGQELQDNLQKLLSRYDVTMNNYVKKIQQTKDSIDE